jgi:hypothetical protein
MEMKVTGLDLFFSGHFTDRQFKKVVKELKKITKNEYWKDTSSKGSSERRVTTRFQPIQLKIDSPEDVCGYFELNRTLGDIALSKQYLNHGDRKCSGSEFYTEGCSMEDIIRIMNSNSDFEKLGE